MVCAMAPTVTPPDRSNPRSATPGALAAGALFELRYRLIFLTLLIGVIGALTAYGFDWLVDHMSGWLLGGIAHYEPPGPGVEPQTLGLAARWWLPLVTTLGGLLSGVLVYGLAPETAGHGTDSAIAAYHCHGGSVRKRVPLLKAITSALTIGSGGVAGREGPTAQIAAGLGGMLAGPFGLRGQERRSLLLATMAAGLSAVFRAPLGMAIFSVEVLYSGMVFESEALIYTVIAAVTSYSVFGLLEGWDSLFQIPAGLTVHGPAALIGFALLGLLAGVMGTLLPQMFHFVQRCFERLPGPPHVRPAIGGLLVGLMAMAVPEVLGTSYGTMELAMVGKVPLLTIVLLLLLKGPAMAFTIGSGGSGGVFAPTVSMGGLLGATLGLTLQSLLPAAHQVPVAAFVVVGMASIFAGVARTPISALIMVAEMTGGYQLMAPAMLATILAFLTQRTLTAGWSHPTLYESQVPRREDSPLHRGVFVRRAMELIDGGALQPAEIKLPRLVSMLRSDTPMPVGHGEAMLAAIDIAPGCALAGHTVAESVGRVEGATAVAILRDETMQVPRGPSSIEAGDRLLVVATQAAYSVLQTRAGQASPGGPTDEEGYSTATNL